MKPHGFIVRKLCHSTMLHCLVNTINVWPYIKIRIAHSNWYHLGKSKRIYFSSTVSTYKNVCICKINNYYLISEISILDCLDYTCFQFHKY